MTLKEFLKLVFIGCSPCILSMPIVATVVMLITESEMIRGLLCLIIAIIEAFLLIKWIEYLAENNKI